MWARKRHKCLLFITCVLELLGGNLAPLPADTSNWHIHQFVRALVPWHIRSDLLAGQGCKNLSLFSLSVYYTR